MYKNIIVFCGSLLTFAQLPDFIAMGLCKKDVTPLLTHWSCVFLALTHQLVRGNSYLLTIISQTSEAAEKQEYFQNY